MGKSIVIGIAGGSGSGKTTLADRVVEYFGDKISIVHHDNYYKAHNELTYEQRCNLNYDHPDSFETELMVEDIKKLKEGKSIDCPVYDYTIHNRSDKVVVIEPKPIILVEGIMIFTEKNLTDLMDIKLYVDTDADIRLIRRIKRDMEARGRSLDSVISQYQQTVKPMHDTFVEPSKRVADVIIRHGGKNQVAFDMIIKRLESHIEELLEENK